MDLLETSGTGDVVETPYHVHVGVAETATQQAGLPQVLVNDILQYISAGNIGL